MSSGSRASRRGQMVLLAAAAIAVALIPMLVAYLQLGYHPNVARPDADHARDVERMLERSLVEAADGAPAAHSWNDRDAAVTTVRDRLAPTLETVNTSALERGTAIQVSLNDSRASAWAADNCPGGPARQFGPCEADRGVVVQERVGRTHVVAAAFDVHVTGQDSDVALRSVIERR